MTNRIARRRRHKRHKRMNRLRGASRRFRVDAGPILEILTATNTILDDLVWVTAPSEVYAPKFRTELPPYRCCTKEISWPCVDLDEEI